jgi:hypothetical protein
MITDPVSVPTSGMSESTNARKASTAGNGARIDDRKMKLRMPLIAASDACPITYRPTDSVICSVRSAKRARREAGAS